MSLVKVKPILSENEKPASRESRLPALVLRRITEAVRYFSKENRPVKDRLILSERAMVYDFPNVGRDGRAGAYKDFYKSLIPATPAAREPLDPT
jgi:hypothetical protein